MSPSILIALAAVSIPFLGVIDYVTGPDMAFSVFYLPPLALVAWTGRKTAALVLSLVAAGTWIAADVAAGFDYSTLLIPIWNTATRLAVFVLVATLVANLRAAHATQERLARTDSLTGVANARTFEEAARAALNDAGTEGYPVTAAYIDLDDFKSINDQLGHSGGDEVLRAVAAALSQNTRSTDLVARLGGDEFVLLAPGTGSDAAKILMNGLVDRVDDHLSQVPMRTTFSAGCVTFLNPPSDVDEMIRAIDELMYEAKRAGKGTFKHLVLGDDVPRRDTAVDLRTADRRAFKRRTH